MDAQSGRTALVEYAAGTTTGARRVENEDAFGIFETTHVFVVADGCGGRSSGRRAANLAVASFAAPPQVKDTDLDLVDPLALAVLAANAAIFREAQTKAEARGQGAALCAARLSPKTISIVHVGDSRVGRCREGDFTWLTEDHTLLWEVRRSGASAQKLAQAAEHASVVTRAVGTQETVTVDLAYHPLSAGDLYLLCSDGLNAQVSNAQISELLLGGTRSLGERSAALLDASESAGGNDNATVILLRVRTD
jgi:PPM family protein phosphatase